MLHTVSRHPLQGTTVCGIVLHAQHVVLLLPASQMEWSRSSVGQTSGGHVDHYPEMSPSVLTSTAVPSGTPSVWESVLHVKDYYADR